MSRFVYRKNGSWTWSSDFPPHACADEDGLLAVGGDLSLETLLEAYANGIFPWPVSEEEPTWWFSPPERFVLQAKAFHLPKSLRRTLGKSLFEIKLNCDFRAVIQSCADSPRPNEAAGTWITPALIEAYVRLHEAGYAHSVESWRDGQLVGGFYGVRVGAVFCGESMFTCESDASKVAFAKFCLNCAAAGIVLIDCQMPTEHLARFGASSISREAYLKQLAVLSQQDDGAEFWRAGKMGD